MISITQSALFIALFVVLTSSIFISSLFKFKSITPYIVTIYLLSFANILFTGELAGLFNLLNNRVFFLLAHILILIVAFILWKVRGAPDLFYTINFFLINYKKSNPWKLFKKHPLLFLLGLGVIASYLLSLILVIKIPPNNFDSMTCHMARIGFWLQHGNFLPWATWFPQQVDYPINAQIQVLWSILFWRTDTFANFSDWIATIISILAVYGVARCLNFTRSKAISASFIYALFPQILLQSSTTMPHIVGSTLVICAFYFLFLGFNDKCKIMFVLSGFSMGLAAGVHNLVYLTLPGFLLSALFLFYKNRKQLPKSFIYIISSFILSFTLLSSYIFIQNTVFFKNPFGQTAVGNSWIPKLDDNYYWKTKNVIKHTYFNLNRYIFASYDLTGISGKVIEPFFTIRDMIFIPIFEKTHIPKQSNEFDIYAKPTYVSENSAWFGMVGFILFLPVVSMGLINSIKENKLNSGILIFNIILYAMIWSTFVARENNWTMYSGRYFIPTALFFAPLISVVYNKNFFNKLIYTFLVIASLYIGYGTMLNNYTKPLISQGAIFKWTRLQKIYNVDWDQYPIGLSIDENVPKKGTLGTLLTSGITEYPFFGEFFQRRVIHIYPWEKIDDTQWLEEMDINWILSCLNTSQPKGFKVITIIKMKKADVSECRLYRRE